MEPTIIIGLPNKLILSYYCSRNGLEFSGTDRELQVDIFDPLGKTNDVPIYEDHSATPGQEPLGIHMPKKTSEIIRLTIGIWGLDVGLRRSTALWSAISFEIPKF